jgi:hypothetical protein
MNLSRAAFAFDGKNTCNFLLVGKSIALDLLQMTTLPLWLQRFRGYLRLVNGVYLEHSAQAAGSRPAAWQGAVLQAQKDG